MYSVCVDLVSVVMVGFDVIVVPWRSLRRDGTAAADVDGPGEAHLDPTGIALILERPGADDVHKSIHMHLNFGLFADILRELAATVGRIPKDDVMHRDQLVKAVAELHTALAKV